MQFKLFDGLRGIAALSVVAYHFGERADLHGMFPRGYLAVDLFFVLSGFVLEFAYAERLRTSLTAGRFVVVRLIRLWPALLLGTLIGAAIELGRPFAGGLASHLAEISFIGLIGCLVLPWPFHTSMEYTIFPLNGPVWSLFFELAANVVFIAVACARRPRVAAFNLMVVGGIGVVALAMAAGTVDFGALTFNWAGGLPRVCFSFFAGVLACSWRHRLPAIDSRVILCMVLVIFMIPVQHGAAGAMVDLTAVLLLFPLLIGAASHSDPRGLPRRLCGFFGDISYPLYAIHYPIVRAICFVMNKHALPAPDRVVIGIATIIALTGGSWIIFRFYDRPARRYLTGRLLSPARSGAATVSWSAPRQPFTYRLWQLWRDTGGGVKTPETLFMRTAQSRDLRGAATGSHDTEWLHDGKIRE